MGRPKKEPAERATYITAGFYPAELRAIERVMRRWNINQSAAIRLLLRRGAGLQPGEDDSTTFTPIEGA